MYKIVICVLVAVGFYGCSSGNEQNGVVKKEWAEMSEAAQDAVCDIYKSTPKDEMLELVGSEMTEAKMDVMESEC